MQKEKLRDKVNAVYGYNAISRVHITQTAPVGFAEGQASFDHHPKATRTAPENPEARAEAQHLAAPVADTSLRAALERLGQNILSRSKH